MEKTATQWKKLGFVLKDGVTGVERTQQYGSRYTYYTENEVRPLTEEVQGDIDNVIGLPVKHVIEVIETLTKKPL